MAIASGCVGRGSRRCAFSKASRQASRSRRKSAITARSSATRASVVAPSCVAVVAPLGKGGKTRWSSAGSICQPFVSSRCAEIRPALMARRMVERLTPVADRKSTRLNSSHLVISYAVFCLKKKKEYCFFLYLEKQKKKKIKDI